MEGKLGILFGNCLKILHSNVPNENAYANSADPDQTAPSGLLFRSGLSCLKVMMSLVNVSLKL